MRRFLNGIVAMTLVGSVSIAGLSMNQSAVYGADNPEAPSSWASKEYELAQEQGLITKSISSNFKNNITRSQFVDAVVNMVEVILSKKMTAANSSAFRDTKDENVLKAYQAGIVTGTGQGQFLPSEIISREQIAAMLYRAVSYIEERTGREFVQKNGDLNRFSDGKKVSPYASDSMSIMVNNGIISGLSEAVLSPKGATTIEQAGLLIYRIYDKTGRGTEKDEAAKNPLNEPDGASAAESVADKVNDERTKADLPALSADPRLEEAAQLRAEEISQKYDHARPDGSKWYTILKELGIANSGAGENIAYGYDTAEAVMKGWMDSQGHRENILRASFTHIGIGYYVLEGRTYWVQIFTAD